ncbi:MAG: type 2 isopentenyl-diphosphate Delta-isomerase [candidate division Zixibacteria bacterium]|nr:type 2 isopentenyl-diphosphate Delta-isomerase [candidate division Zixibacteria bacterium]
MSDKMPLNTKNSLENSLPDTLIARRKDEHLKIAAEHDVSHSFGTLLNDIKLVHQALPELNSAEVDLSVEFFGKKLSAPLMITSMTGGSESAGKMNRSMAKAANKLGIAFAVGSQRVMLNHPETTSDFQVRREIPDGVLLGNIGAVQLQEYSAEVIAGLVDTIDADGLCIHLNAAQELVQKEGHRDFRGLLDKIARLVDRFEGKALIKETGAGLSPETLRKLKSIGAHYVDVSGAGGTSWTKVETYRDSNSELFKLGETLADWGLPTAFCIIAAKKILDDDACIIASGGIKSGLDAARAIAAGSNIAGFARQALLSFIKDEDNGVAALIEQTIKELKTTMLLTDCKDINALKKAPRIYTGQLRHWLADYGWLEGEKN